MGSSTSFGGSGSGPGGAARYVHDQAIAADVWTVVHNLNCYPSATVVDSANEVVLVEIEYLDLNTLEVKLGSAHGGKAYIN